MSMQSVLLIVLSALCFFVQFGLAQEKQYSATSGAGSTFTPPPGPIVIEPHPFEPVTSLDQLIRMSPLIVDGVVTTILPSIVRNPNIPGEVETDALVTIQSVILGKAPSGSQFLFEENGGDQGGWTVTVAGNPRVNLGERYIFFLQPDPRSSIPNSFGVIPPNSSVARYYATVDANGKARVTSEELIAFSSGAIPVLQQYNNASLSVFLAKMTARIGVLFPTPPPYPSNVTPLKPPPNTIFPTAPMKVN
jgi:hypothetical protein